MCQQTLRPRAMRQQTLRPSAVRARARVTAERGFSTLELTLAMPLVVFAILLLIGLGHALISKQHAVVGGQFAAHYQRVREAAPDAAAIGRAVSGGGESVELSGGGDKTLNFTVSATPRKGLIAQTYRLKATASQYQTPNVTNACVPRSKFPFIHLPRCKPPFEAFSKILNRQLVTNIITNGLRTAFSPENILSTITGIGNKKRRQNPDGAVAAVPVTRPPRNSDPENGGPQPAAGGGGGGGTPRNPTGGGVGTGGPDDGKPGGNGNNNGNNGDSSNGNGRNDNGGNGNGNGGNGSSALPPPTRRPGEGIVTNRPIQWGNPRSVAAYGHSMNRHGSQRPPQQLKDRARSTRTPQGQFYDNNTIVEAEQRAPVSPGVYDIPMGRPVGRVYMPDGTVVQDATRVRVIRRPDGTIETSFPII